MILKVLVGSRAHGLAHETSDFDYRGVFVTPSREFFKLDGSLPKATSWIEGDKSAAEPKEDATAWELGHFLKLAVNASPTILEVFHAPIRSVGALGYELRALFPSIWEPKKVAAGAIGYGENQRAKLLANKDNRAVKYACAWLRTLAQTEFLLREGSLPVADLEQCCPNAFELLREWRLNGPKSTGEVVDTCALWQKMVEGAAQYCKHQPDPAKVEIWLQQVRKESW